MAKTKRIETWSRIQLTGNYILFRRGGVKLKTEYIRKTSAKSNLHFRLLLRLKKQFTVIFPA